LPFLDVDCAARSSGGNQQVGLAAEEGGDLEDVTNFGGWFGLVRLMDVCQDAVAFRFEGREDAETLLQARSAVGGNGRPVGLVERGLEDEARLDARTFSAMK